MTGISKISEVHVTPLTKGNMGCHSTSAAPSLCWHLCYCFAGVFALVALGSLPSLYGHLCPCCAVVFVLIALAGIIRFVALVSPLLLCWRCCPYCVGIIALVALASLPAFCTGVNRPHCAGIFTVIFLALSPKVHISLVFLPLFHWHCHHRCVVLTNVGAQMIVCICTCSPLHAFAAVRDLVFDCGNDRDAFLGLLS